MMLSFTECYSEPTTLLSILPTVPQALPAVLQRRDTSIPKMREARIYGVSQLAQGHSARKWQSWVLSCLPILSYSESQNLRHPPQAHRHVCFPAPQW